MTHLNTPLKFGATDARRSGVHEMKETQIKEHAYIVSRMKVRLCSRMEYTLGFVVSRHRGEIDHIKVRRQKEKATYSRYAESLLSDMLRNW